MKKKGVESYMHKCAKQIVSTWLRSRSKVGEKFQGLQPVTPHIPLLPKTFGPMFGVYEEYPICKNRKTGALIGMEGWSGYCKAAPLKVAKMHGIPSQKEIRLHAETTKALTMEYFFDIGLLDAASKLCFVVEICHKNPMEDAKIAWLKENNVGWVELNAEWVMTRVRAPYSLRDGILRASFELPVLESETIDENEEPSDE